MERERFFMKKVRLFCTTAMLALMVNSSVSYAQENMNVGVDDRQVENVTQQLVVSTFEELKAALSENNGITQVELGADIEITNGISISPNKKSVIIDGAGHTLKEKRKGAHGTIYISKNNTTNDVSLKNLVIEGLNYYGPVNVDDAVKGVTLNYENVIYRGPQLVHNVHGYAKFTGNNTINIHKNSTNSDVAQELFEGLGFDISGEFTLVHEGKTDSAFWFGLGNDHRPYLNIADNAKVQMDILYNTLFYVDHAATKPLDITIGKDAKFDVNTQRELFRLGHAGNVKFLENSMTNILRNYSNNKIATLKLNNSSFDVEPTASLNILHEANVQAPIFKSENNSSIMFNKAKNIELKTSPGYKVFDAKKTTLDVVTDNLKSWYNNATEVPDYQNTNLLEATIAINGNTTELVQSNQLDILDHWNIPATNHLVLNGSEEKIETPILNSITDQDVQLTGTGIPGNKIIITVAGVQIGETVVDSVGKWVCPLKDKLTAGAIVEAVQTDGHLVSEAVKQEVQHLDAKTENMFALGYWQDYGMILEGLIDNKEWDLSNTDNIHKFINLIAENGDTALKVDAANTNWFGDPSRFNGYQAILTNESLASLPEGKYKVQVEITGPSIDEKQDLISQSNQEVKRETTPYRNKFDEIDARTVSGKNISTAVQDGQCFIVIG